MTKPVISIWKKYFLTISSLFAVQLSLTVINYPKKIKFGEPHLLPQRSEMRQECGEKKSFQARVPLSGYLSDHNCIVEPQVSLFFVVSLRDYAIVNYNNLIMKFLQLFGRSENKKKFTIATSIGLNERLDALKKLFFKEFLFNYSKAFCVSLTWVDRKKNCTCEWDKCELQLSLMNVLTAIKYAK